MSSGKLRALRGSWTFEPASDGTLLFYPHGWGRAYVIPTEEDRRGIEKLLELWQTRLESAFNFARVVLLPIVAIPIVLLSLLVFRPFWDLAAYVGSWVRPFMRFEMVVGTTALLIFAGSPLALRLVAETANRGLEKAPFRKPVTEFLRDVARRSEWSRLWIEELAFALFLLQGISFLRLHRKGMMYPFVIFPEIDRHLAGIGLCLIFCGAVMGTIRLWQMKEKLRADHSVAKPAG